MAEPRRYSLKALAGGLVAYGLAKLVAIGVVASATLTAFIQDPGLMLPVAAAQLGAELAGAGVLLLVLLLIFRIAPRGVFVGVAAVQLALAWVSGFGVKDAGLGWLFGSEAVRKAFDWAGQPVPYVEPTVWGGLTAAAIGSCVAAGLVGQALHNAVVLDRREP